MFTGKDYPSHTLSHAKFTEHRKSEITILDITVVIFIGWNCKSSKYHLQSGVLHTSWSSDQNHREECGCFSSLCNGRVFILRVPNGVFQTVFFRFPTLSCNRENPLQRGKECAKTPLFSSILERSGLTDPGHPLNTPN